MESSAAAPDKILNLPRASGESTELFTLMFLLYHKNVEIFNKPWYHLHMEDGKGSPFADDFASTLKDLMANFSAQDPSGGISVYVRLVLGALILLAVIFAAYMIARAVKGRRMRRMQAERFERTLELLHDFGGTGQRGGFGDGPGEEGVNPSVENTDTGGDFMDPEELRRLVVKCQELGARIDSHTDRRNNSRTVSELVFKVSMALGLEQDTATLYFCAALVYDAGFLDVPEDLFRIEILSAREKKQLKTHVMRGIGYYDFIPESWRGLFVMVSMLHHENLNGTGYPEGLHGESIPLLPRILHVVESYVSLVTPRRYHKIRGKSDAVQELRSQPHIYDCRIVDALESVI